MIRPVFAEIAGSWPSPFSLAQISAVRRSCQTMARCTALAGGAVPHHGGLALVGDADRRDVLGCDARLLQRVAAGGDRRGPDVLRFVLDPARRRKMLRELGLRCRRDRDVAAKHNGARGCGALIDGQHKGHGGFSWRILGVACVKASGLGQEGQEGGVAPGAFFLLPLREKVLREAKADEGSVSADTDPSPVCDAVHP